MHIKKVIINGFKSYINASTDYLSPNINVIVGKNGAGKSNFIDAICFVLNHDKFNRLKGEERASFINSGSGVHTQSASVTIVFDNKDQRLPLETNEVILKRTIGVKKDEYYLNNRHVTCEEIHSLLETAGLSHSNPYNIVMQGQVRALVDMTPRDRLNLLKEVAGARVYDEKRGESLRILSEAECKRSKITQILEMLSKRLSDLQVEKEELTEYQRNDRMKRAIEYTMRDYELKSIECTLRELDGRRTELANRIGDYRVKDERVEAELGRLNVELKQCKVQMEQYELLLGEIKLEWKRCEESRLIGESGVIGLMEMGMATVGTTVLIGMKDDDGREYSEMDVEERMRCVEEWIERDKAAFLEVEKRYEEMEVEEMQLDEEVMRLEGIMEKRRRREDVVGFETVEQFERYRQETVRQLREDLNEHERCWNKLGDEIGALESRYADLNSMMEEERDEYERYCAAIKKLEFELEKVENRRDMSIDARKELWRNEMQLKIRYDNLKEDVVNIERELYLGMSGDVARGLKFIREATDRLNLGRNVYGPIIDLFELEEEYYTCVEVAAGNKLFNVVVDTDQTASMLLRSLNREGNGMGRVTIMPLNRLVFKRVGLKSGRGEGMTSDVSTELAMGILGKIRYDEKFEKAFEQVFGKVFLCMNLDIAFDVAHMNGCTCVTLEGDLVNSRGAVKGGYYERRSGRLYLNSMLKGAKEELGRIEGELKRVQIELDMKDQEVNAVVKTIDEVRRQLAMSRDSYERYLASMRDVERQNVSIRSILQKKRELYNKEHLAMENIELRIRHVDTLVFGDESGQLGVDRDEMMGFERKRDRIQVLRGEKERLECERVRLEKHLLMYYEEKSRLKIVSGGQRGDDDGMENRRRELLRDLEVRMDRYEVEMNAMDERRRKILEQMEQLRNEKYGLESERVEIEKELEQILNGKYNWISKRDQLKKRVYEIGILSNEELGRCMGMEYATLVDELKAVKKVLSRFSKVNKKAIDQYLLFDNERAKFQRRLELMDRENESIRNLIKKLDMQKDEVLIRTFRGVSMAFKKIFSKLTDGCRGDLIMQQCPPSSETPSLSGVDSYVGINIAVSFEKNSEKLETINQLSGGQQSLVALSLIFAIQKNDPAPFYVFDEIDPALDNQHRKMVAKLLTKASHGHSDSQIDLPNTQFIVTTHGIEFVNVSDQTILISFNNKISQIENIPKNTALEMIKLNSAPILVDAI